MQFFISKQRSLFSIHDEIGVKLLTRLQIKFSHINEHKFCHKFRDRVRSICNCGAEIETTLNSFLCCQFLATERQNLHDDLYLIDRSIISFDEKSL